MKNLIFTILLLIFGLPIITPASPQEAKNGMVVTSEPIATQIGVKILKQGGNAIDAAVAVGFALAVTYPRAGNLGGGGFMLIYSAKTGQVVAIDYRETAPALAHRDMFLNQAGEVDNQLSRFSYLAAGVPGTVAGFALALEKYGSLSLAEVLAPAIQLAEQGFVVSPKLSREFKNLSPTPTIFLKPDGSFYEAGEILIQNDLAKTLKSLSKHGVKEFYQGEIAELIVKEMQTHGGLISKTDLANYKAVIRKPIHGSYQGYDIYSMSPPSSGGIHIVQILNMLENDNLAASGHNSAATIHIMTEAMKRAYADRSKYLGDPDFVTIPVEGLTSKSYAAQLRAKFNLSQATPSQEILPGTPPTYESNETTHYSIVDKAGNAVSNTYTLNFSYGSRKVVQGAGFLFNNEMDDFSAKTGIPNAYGLIGGTANAIEPNKRMLSSMSPTIVLKNGKVFLVTGSPGGSRIITTTLQVILNVIEHQMNIQTAVNAVRVHHQWLPDELRIETGLNLDTIHLLQARGHRIVRKNPMGAASSILIDNKKQLYYGAADPRRGGLALGF